MPRYYENGHMTDRQMLFDIENAYNEFFRSLSGKSS